MIVQAYMGIAELSAREKEIVLCCMKAAAAHIDDFEKQSRLGVDADCLRDLMIHWPEIDDRMRTAAVF